MDHLIKRDVAANRDQADGSSGGSSYPDKYNGAIRLMADGAYGPFWS